MTIPKLKVNRTQALAIAPRPRWIGREPDPDADHEDHDHGSNYNNDDVHGYWSEIPSRPGTYQFSVGDKLSFKYTPYHNIYLMVSQSAFELCNFTGAAELANTTHGGV